MAKHNSTRPWLNHFKSIGLPETLIAAYMSYVEAMHARRLPVIFEFRHLAALLGRCPLYLATVVNGSAHHYRTFSIPKRRGGKREITAPFPALLDCQQWIVRNILEHIPVHSAAEGFRKGHSIKTNAARHLGHSCLLKMDLADFFPSIGIRRVIAVFRRAGYPRNVSAYLGRICTREDCLPQGSAASPILSNIIAAKMDKRLTGLAKKYGLRYSRYADDLAFSGPYISVKMSRLVAEIVESEGFRVNHEKTRLSRWKGRKMITGLSVAGMSIQLPREYKRRLKQEVHYITKFGYFSHVQKKNIRRPFYLESLIGKVVYWKWVEPDHPFPPCALKQLRDIRSHLIGA